MEPLWTLAAGASWTFVLRRGAVFEVRRGGAPAL